MKNAFFLLFFTLFGFLNAVHAQNISNEGNDFWLAFPTHDPNSATLLAEMNVNVTSKFDSEVTVTCGSYSATKPVLANKVVTFTLPRAQSYINYTDRNTPLSNKAIHVTVTAGKPNVSVYSHVYASARSAASLILPTAALGQKYFSMNYTQDAANNPLGFPARNFLLLVATEDNTKLLIQTKNNGTIPVTLAKTGDVYEYVPNGTSDLTGTFVEVDASTDSKCKKFAAYSGSTSLILSCNGSRDPLFQQLYPINSWGKTYGVVPFVSRRFIIRVLAQENNTNVMVGSTSVTINKGEFYETPISTEPLIVSADKLISVAQYSLTQACSGSSGSSLIGDPEMVLLNPMEFNINKVTLFSSGKNAIDNRFINVFMKTEKTGTFKVNGALPLGGSWQLMPSNPTYSYLQIDLGLSKDDGEVSFTLTADDGFNAIAYGFGNAESYAYSAGTNLASSQFLKLVNKVTNIESSTGCIDQSADFKVTLPYLLDKIVWKLGDGDPDYVDSAPSPTSSVVNGETLYTYQAPVNKKFKTIGPKTIVAIGTLSTAQNVCANTREIEFNFILQVDPLPIADFEAAAVGCSKEVISFTDKSTTNVDGRKVSKWSWDFNDGTPIDNNQNPTHTFAAAGVYNVKLTVASEAGCGSLVVSKQITINPKPTALFAARKTTCIKTDITFADQSSVAAGGVITKWTWDFGDGTPLDNTPSPTHSYASTGKYTVTLMVETDKGCVSLAYNDDITITGLPTADFSLPDVCLADAEAVFVNSSLDYDGTTTGLTYSWDFGDPTSGPLNTSAQINGTHKYSSAGVYKVVLTVKNSNGCEVTKTENTFTVNGSVPLADFVIPPQPVCSNQSFSVVDKSTVDIGNITRLEWYIDNVLYSVDEDPTKDKSYTFNYPQFFDRPTKTIKLKLIAFSGSITGSCSNMKEQDVVLMASPVVEFNPLASVCINGGTVQFVAKDLGNLPGNGTFSGPGVSTSGLFDPMVAKVGIHDITYTFVAYNGCTDQATQQIEVYPAPQVNAGDDFYILVGGERQLEATATGRGLTYKWFPAAGLDRDDVLNPLAKPEQDTKYTLTVISDQGCTVSDQVYVHVLQNVNAPNSFTPNGDGVNDVWNIKYLDTYPNATVEIYDRAGQRIYFSKGYAVPFNGTYNNQALPVGTYYYIISPNSGRKSITGHVTIIK